MNAPDTIIWILSVIWIIFIAPVVLFILFRGLK